MNSAETDQGNEKPQGAGASAAENGEAEEKGCGSKKAAAEVKDFEYVDDFCGTAEEHRNSLYISMESRPLHLAAARSLDATKQMLKKMFEDELGVSIPKLRLPDLHRFQYFEMRNAEDKFKVLSICSKLPKPIEPDGRNDALIPPLNSNVKSIILRAEGSIKFEPGTVDEALDILLPLRQTPYKEQLSLKLEGLNEIVENVANGVQEMRAKTGVAPQKEADTRRVKSVVPMIPNVGYERSVFLHFGRDRESKKITVGMRIFYEKDGVKKACLVPASKCDHVAPLAVKAAEALAEHLTDEKFEVYNGKTVEHRLYGLNVAMTGNGEMIMTVIAVINDRFLKSFCDVNMPDSLPKIVVNHFARAAQKAANAESQKKANQSKKVEVERNVNLFEEEVEDDDCEEEWDEWEPKEELMAAERGEKIKLEGDELRIQLQETIKSLKLLKGTHDHFQRPIAISVLKYSKTLKDFFEKRGPSLGISGISLSWRATNMRPANLRRKIKERHVICGSTSLFETVCDTDVELVPYRDIYNQSYMPSILSICNAIIASLPTNINSAFIACEEPIVLQFFAKKFKKMVAYTTMMGRTELIKMRKDPNVMFISPAIQRPSRVSLAVKFQTHFGGLPDVLIQWGLEGGDQLKQLRDWRPKNYVVVLDPRPADPEGSGFLSTSDTLKNSWTECTAHYTLKTIVAVDIFPMKNDPIPLVVFYEALPGRSVLPLTSKELLDFRSTESRDNSVKGQENPGKKRKTNAKPGIGSLKPPNAGWPPASAGRGGFTKRPRIDDARTSIFSSIAQRSIAGRYEGAAGSSHRPPAAAWNDGWGQDGPEPYSDYSPYSRGGRWDGGRQPVPGRPYYDDGADQWGNVGNFFNDAPPRQSARVAKTVLSRLNSMIERELMTDDVEPPRRPVNFRGGYGGQGGYGGHPSNFGRGRGAPPQPSDYDAYFDDSFNQPGYIGRRGGSSGNFGGPARGGYGGGYQDGPFNWSG